MPSPMEPPSFADVMANVTPLELSANSLLENVARCAKSGCQRMRKSRGAAT